MTKSARDYFPGEGLGRRGQQARRMARLEQWFVLAVEQERLHRLTSPAGRRRRDHFMKQHPNAGLITAAFLHDILLLATDRDERKAK